MSNSPLTIENVIEIINGLNNPALNKQYEEQLSVISEQYGFGVALAKLASDKSFEQFQRQFAAILLKRYIQSHWEDIGISDEDDEDEILNNSNNNNNQKKRIATAEEKSQIKNLLSPSLSDPSSKVRTAIAMCIARIGSFEWPKDWPGLVDELIKCLNPNNSDLLDGAIRCLEVLGDPEFLSEEQTNGFMDLVFPIYADLLTKEIGEMEHIRIINVFRKTVTHITFIKSISKMLSTKLSTYLPTWIPIFVNHLSRVLDLSSKYINHHFTVMTGIIEILTILVQSYPKKMTVYIQQILSPIWTLFNSLYPIYEKAEINPVHGVISNFVEDGVTKIENLVTSVFDFIFQVVSKKNFSALFKPFLKQIYLTSLHYMQMTYELIDNWENEPNAYLESEDDNSFTPRVIAATLIQDMCSIYGKDGISSFFESISECLNEANSNKEKNPSSWWKIREASLYAISNSASPLIKSKLFDVSQFLQTNLTQDFIDVPNTPSVGLHILRGRSIICASKLFAKNVDSSVIVQFFRQAIHLLNSDESVSPLQLKISAIIAIGGFASKIERESIIQFIPDTIKLLLSNMNQFNGDSLALLLECISLLIKIDKDITGQMEPLLIQHLSQTWVNYANDPIINDELKDIFRTISACPKSYPGILQRMIPTLNIILNSYNNPLYISISDSAVDITGVIMARIEQTIDKFLLEQLFQPLLNILINESNNREIIKASLYAVLPFVYKTSAELMSQWTFTPNGSTTPITGLQAVLLICKRILFEFDPLVSVEIPPIINGVLVHHSESIKNQLPTLFDFLLQAFYNAKIPSQKQGFASIFARLIIQHKSLIIDYLAGIPGPKNKGTALEFVLNEWQKHHFDLTNKLDNNVSVVAMCTLFYLGDKRLETIQVDGELNLPEKTTRNRTKKEAEKWTSELLFNKIISNLWDVINMEKKELELINNSTINNNDNIQDTESEDETEEDEDTIPTEEDIKKYYGNILIENGFANAEDFAYQMDHDNDNDNDSLGFNDEFGENIIDILTKSDPIYNLQIIPYLTEFFGKLQIASPSVYALVAPVLNELKVEGYKFKTKPSQL